MENLLNVLEEAQRVTGGLNEAPSVASAGVEKPKHWKKPKDMPRRPLSAYNLFFKSERQKMVTAAAEEKKEKGRGNKTLGIGFAGMARNIATKWKALPESERSVFDADAKVEKMRYRKEISVWKSKQPSKTVSKKAKETKAETKKSSSPPIPLKPTSSTTMASHCAFDASDVTGQSLHKIMQESLMRGHRQPAVSPDFANPMQVLSSQPSMDCSPRSSLYPLYINVAPSAFQSNHPLSAVEPLLGDHDPLMQETVPDSCWKALALNLGSDSYPSNSVNRMQSSIDDLALFMYDMEDERY